MNCARGTRYEPRRHSTSINSGKSAAANSPKTPRADPKARAPPLFATLTAFHPTNRGNSFSRLPLGPVDVDHIDRPARGMFAQPDRSLLAVPAPGVIEAPANGDEIDVAVLGRTHREPPSRTATPHPPRPRPTHRRPGRRPVPTQPPRLRQAPPPQPPPHRCRAASGSLAGGKAGARTCNTEAHQLAPAPTAPSRAPPARSGQPMRSSRSSPHRTRGPARPSRPTPWPASCATPQPTDPPPRPPRPGR